MKNYLWEEKTLSLEGEEALSLPHQGSAGVKLHLFQSRKAASQGDQAALRAEGAWHGAGHSGIQQRWEGRGWMGRESVGGLSGSGP